ncbi:MAG: hypothetical protein WCH11_02550 [Bdellovibrio sp.]
MQLRMGYDLHTQGNVLLQPRHLQIWPAELYAKFKPQPPFLYKADALVGLSLLLLHKKLSLPQLAGPTVPREFIESVWNELEPHQEMFLRSQNRVRALRQGLKKTASTAISSFENEFQSLLHRAFLSEGVDYLEMEALVEVLDFFETRLKRNLLFQFEIQFQESFVRELQYLYSLLFHTRNLIVMDFNSQIQDPSH